MNREAGRDLLHFGYVGVETIEEDVIHADEGIPRVHGEPHEVVEMPLPARARVRSLPARDQPQRTGFFELECGGRVVSRRKLLAPGSGDPQVHPPAAHQLPGTPDTGQGQALLPLQLELKHAVVDYQSGALFGGLDAMTGGRFGALASEHERAAIGAERCEITLIVEKEPPRAAVGMALQNPGLQRLRFASFVRDRNRLPGSKHALRERNSDRQRKVPSVLSAGLHCGELDGSAGSGSPGILPAAGRKEQREQQRHGVSSFHATPPNMVSMECLAGRDHDPPGERKHETLALPDRG